MPAARAGVDAAAVGPDRDRLDTVAGPSRRGPDGPLPAAYPPGHVMDPA